MDKRKVKIVVRNKNDGQTYVAVSDDFRIGFGWEGGDWNLTVVVNNRFIGYSGTRTTLHFDKGEWGFEVLPDVYTHDLVKIRDKKGRVYEGEMIFDTDNMTACVRLSDGSKILAYTIESCSVRGTTLTPAVKG